MCLYRHQQYHAFLAIPTAFNIIEALKKHLSASLLIYLTCTNHFEIQTIKRWLEELIDGQSNLRVVKQLGHQQDQRQGKP